VCPGVAGIGGTLNPSGTDGGTWRGHLCFEGNEE